MKIDSLPSEELNAEASKSLNAAREVLNQSGTWPLDARKEVLGKLEARLSKEEVWNYKMY